MTHVLVIGETNPLVKSKSNYEATVISPESIPSKISGRYSTIIIDLKFAGVAEVEKIRSANKQIPILSLDQAGDDSQYESLVQAGSNIYAETVVELESYMSALLPTYR